MNFQVKNNQADQFESKLMELFDDDFSIIKNITQEDFYTTYDLGNLSDEEVIEIEMIQVNLI